MTLLGALLTLSVAEQGDLLRGYGQIAVIGHNRAGVLGVVMTGAEVDVAVET